VWLQAYALGLIPVLQFQESIILISQRHVGPLRSAKLRSCSWHLAGCAGEGAMIA
jgi:hypothetical protein